MNISENYRTYCQAEDINEKGRAVIDAVKEYAAAFNIPCQIKEGNQMHSADYFVIFNKDCTEIAHVKLVLETWDSYKERHVHCMDIDKNGNVTTNCYELKVIPFRQNDDDQGIKITDDVKFTKSVPGKVCQCFCELYHTDEVQQMAKEQLLAKQEREYFEKLEKENPQEYFRKRYESLLKKEKNSLCPEVSALEKLIYYVKESLGHKVSRLVCSYENGKLSVYQQKEPKKIEVEHGFCRYEQDPCEKLFEMPTDLKGFPQFFTVSNKSTCTRLEQYQFKSFLATSSQFSDADYFTFCDFREEDSGEISCDVLDTEEFIYKFLSLPEESYDKGSESLTAFYSEDGIELVAYTGITKEYQSKLGHFEEKTLSLSDETKQLFQEAMDRNFQLLVGKNMETYMKENQIER